MTFQGNHKFQHWASKWSRSSCFVFPEGSSRSPCHMLASAQDEDFHEGLVEGMVIARTIPLGREVEPRLIAVPVE